MLEHIFQESAMNKRFLVLLCMVVAVVVVAGAGIFYWQTTVSVPEPLGKQPSIKALGVRGYTDEPAGGTDCFPEGDNQTTLYINAVYKCLCNI